MKLKQIATITTLSMILSASLFSSEIKLNNNKQDEIKASIDLEKAYINSVIPNSKIEKYEKAEIDGLYKVYFENGQMFYVHPFKKLIFFGEIYNNKGYSYTQNDTKAWQKEMSSKQQNKIIDNYKPDDFTKIAKAVVFGTGASNYEFIIFSDPKCHYCKIAEELISKGNTKLHYIYTSAGISEESPKLSKIILSSKDMQQAISDVRAGKTPDIQVTSDAEKQYENMQVMAKELNVVGTPRILVVDKKAKKIIEVINGANESVIKKYLEK